MYRKSIDPVKLLTISHPFSFKSGQILAAPHDLPPIFWLGRPRVFLIITSYPTPYLESFICLFMLFRVYVRGPATRLHQSYHLCRRSFLVRGEVVWLRVVFHTQFYEESTICFAMFI